MLNKASNISRKNINNSLTHNLFKVDKPMSNLSGQLFQYNKLSTSSGNKESNYYKS